MQGEATIDRPWLASWPAGVPKSIDYPDISVDELLRRAAKEYANRPAISFYGKSISYGELDQAADRFAAGLRKIGVRRGDRVSLVLPNTPHFIVAFFGVLRAGGIVMQTNPLFRSRELEQLWTDAGVQTVIALDLFWHNVSKAKTNAGVKRVVVCDVGEFLKTPLRQLYPIKKKRDLRKQGHWPLVIPDEEGVHRFGDLVRTPGGPAAEKPEGADEIAVLQYTGGTTGTSKGAMLTHRNLVANAMQTAAWFPQGTHGPEKVLGAIPMFHVYGLTAVMLFSTVTGNEVVLYPNPREIGAILKLINKTKPSLFPGVPTMYIAILRHPKLAKYDLRSIRACLSGAAPLPNEVRKQFESATGGRLVEGYGLTEASPVTHWHPVPGHRREGGRPGRSVESALARRGRRTRGPRSPGDERLLEQTGGNPERPARWLAPHGRLGQDGPGWLFLHRGPEKGHDHLLRLQRVPTGSRGGPLHASRRRRSRGDRRPRPLPRRDRQGVRGPEARADRDRGGPHRVLQRAAGAVQSAEGGRVRDGPSDVAGRKGPAAAVAGARAREGIDRAMTLTRNGSMCPRLRRTDPGHRLLPGCATAPWETACRKG